MLPKLPASSLASTCVVAALLAFPACSLNVKKGDNGEDKRVDISTPVGGIHVSQGADPRDTGLPVYPGARLKDKGAGDDKNSANVNISSSFFGLKVVAVEYLSDDSPDKLIAFYKDRLKSYGNVLECHTEHRGDPGDVNVNIDSKDPKAHELNCGPNKGSTIELKVGSQENQHIVSIGPQDGGGKGSDFALVYVQVHGGDKDKGTI
jgi:hypothetical protein